MKIEDLNDYFSGSKLIGDDYTETEILQWYEEEKDAYSGMIESGKSYFYEYHALNELCAFRVLNNATPMSLSVCGFGSALGDELKPIRRRILNTVLIDSSSSFNDRQESNGIKRLAASPLGKINIDSNSFDVITCFGVLHHIPNVTFVINELHRCLKPGGVLLLREPTSSMGDWRNTRPGVTKNERGIPEDILNEILLNVGFDMIEKTRCVFPPFFRLCKKVGLIPYNNSFLVKIDLFLCSLFKKNYRYHRVKLIEKFAPASMFVVCKK